MAFTSKNLQSKTGGMTLIKGATLFFLGMSCVLFLTQAFDIVPSVGNRVQLIKEVLFTTDGSQGADTGAYIDGLSGNAYFAGTVTGTTICLAGDTCRTTWPTAGGNSVWSTGSNRIYYNSGNVGIGTTSPAEKLDVNGNIQLTHTGGDRKIAMGMLIGNVATNLWILGSQPGVSSPAGAGASGGDIYIKAGSGGIGGFSAGPGGTIYINGGNPGSGPHPTSGNVVLVNDGGRVGIGTTGPAEKLEVNGTGKFTSVKVGSNLSLYSDSSYSNFESLKGINFNTDGSTTPKMTITPAGNVGIGTGSPTEQFQIGNYAWIGQNTGALLGTGGRFLRIYGDNPTDNNAHQLEGPMTYSAGEESDYAPNIQLNYRTYNSLSTSTHEYYNWKMVGDTSFGLRYSTGPVMPTKMFSISPLGETWVSSKLSIGTNSKRHSITLDGNIRLMNSGYIAASSSSASTTNANQLFLGTNGNVGIGTANPQTRLDVDGGIRPKTILDGSNPCGVDYPQGTQYYNSYYDKYCYCSSGNIARPIGETGTACYVGGSLPPSELL